MGVSASLHMCAGLCVREDGAVCVCVVWCEGLRLDVNGGLYPSASVAGVWFRFCGFCVGNPSHMSPGRYSPYKGHLGP